MKILRWSKWLDFVVGTTTYPISKSLSDMKHKSEIFQALYSRLNYLLKFFNEVV